MVVGIFWYNCIICIYVFLRNYPDVKEKRRYRCVLCKRFFKRNEMSAEHYPSKSVRNNDIIALDFVKMLETIQSPEVHGIINSRVLKGERFKEVTGEIFDNYIAKDLYPKGRINQSLCRTCNTFLGKYDESY